MNQPFDFSSRYYDLIYQEKDTLAEVNYIDSLLSKYSVSGKNVIEFGSGTGRHAALLASKGYKILGIERSEAMVASARICKGFDCLQGDITSIHIDQSFDAVLSLFHVVSYQV